MVAYSFTHGQEQRLHRFFYNIFTVTSLEYKRNNKSPYSSMFYKHNIHTELQMCSLTISFWVNNICIFVYHSSVNSSLYEHQTHCATSATIAKYIIIIIFTNNISLALSATARAASLIYPLFYKYIIRIAPQRRAHPFLMVCVLLHLREMNILLDIYMYTVLYMYTSRFYI